MLFLRKKTILDIRLIVILFVFSFLVADKGFCLQGGSNNLKIVFFDVGQGDAAFIETPGSKRILIDAGPASGVITSYFKKNGIGALDAVIISHSHPDHVGGLAAILKELAVREVYETGRDSGDQEYKDCLGIMAEKGISDKKVFEGDILKIDPELHIEVLSPAKAKLFETFNDNSLVIKLIFKEVSLLLPGDIETEAEQVLVEKYGDKLKSNVLKSPHHGSYKSSTLAFMKKVRPDIVVISCGLVNDFGHPSSTILFRYKKLGAKVLRTDLNGTITLETDGKEIKTETEKTSPN
jgi:competence protein ComEC